MYIYMRRLYVKVILLLAITVVSCSKEDATFQEEDIQQVFPENPLTIEEINATINATITNTGDFDWNAADTHFLWSAVKHGQNLLTIGYGSEGEYFSEIRTRDIENKKEAVLNIVLEQEGVAKEDLKLVEHEIINVVDVYVDNINTIVALKKSPYVRYLEPNGYNQFGMSATARSSSGCSKNGESINTSHYTTVSPNNAQVSWHFSEHNIPQAWNLSTGSGVTIGLIDTGVSQSQSLLNSSGFNDGVPMDALFKSMVRL